MNRIRNVQILFLLGAAALLSACTSVTTTVPSGRAPAFEARADQVVVIDPANVAAELHTQVEPLLAETAGRDRVIVVSYSLAPSDETLRSVLDFIKMRTAPGDIVKVERDFIAHLGLAVTVRDPKVSAYRWWNAQAVSDNFAHATARNLAQQAAEPSDLETPRIPIRRPRSAQWIVISADPCGPSVMFHSKRAAASPSNREQST